LLNRFKQFTIFKLEKWSTKKYNTHLKLQGIVNTQIKLHITSNQDRSMHTMIICVLNHYMYFCATVGKTFLKSYFGHWSCPIILPIYATNKF